MEIVGSTVQSSLAFLRQYRDERPTELDDDRFVTLHAWFLRQLSTIDTLADCLNPSEHTSYRGLCSRCHKRYLAIVEREANKKLLAIGRKGARSTGENLTGRDRRAYDRVRDLKTLVDFRNCKDVAMVGSGAFPSALLWLRDNFPLLRYVGLDIDPDCVKMATELVSALGIDNIRFEPIDGREYDFGGFDFAYVANHVVPKRAVLAQIARSTSVRQVVVREPTPVGALLAETVRDDLPTVFVADAADAPRGIGQMSYDLLLRRA